MASQRHLAWNPPAASRPWLVFAVAVAVLSLGLGNATGVTFDEYYYLPEARDLLSVGAPTTFPYHPPLAKLLIALGIWVFGDDPVGWRVASVVAGAASVAMLFVLARRLFADDRLATVAAALFLLDGSFVALARAGMLDVFVVAGFLAATLLTLHVTGAPDDRLRAGPWLLLGAVIGLSVAVKWSALVLLAAPALALLARWRRDARQPSLPVLLAAMGIAATSYLVTWTPWLVNHEVTDQYDTRCLEDGRCDSSLALAVADLVDLHVEMTGSLAGQHVDHPQRSQPWTWPLGWRPMVLFEDTCRGEPIDPAHCVPPGAPQHRIVGLPNVFVWWSFLLGIPALFAGARRGERAAAVALLGWAIVLFPLFAFDRTAFLYWFAPAVPFLVVGSLWVVTRARRSDWRAAPAAAALASVLALLGWLLPERVPHQVALLGVMGWLCGTLVGALTARSSRGSEPPDAELEGTRAWRGALALLVPSLVVAVLLHPIVRGVPLAPGNWRLALVDHVFLNGFDRQ